MRMLNDKIAWEKNVFKKTIRSFGDVGLTPEMTIKMVLQVEPVHVDMDYKTDVEGLWAIGKITSTGSCYFGWTRGDGLGNGTTTAIMAAPRLVEYTEQHDFEDLQIDQIAEMKEKIYAPLNRPTTRKPRDSKGFR